MTKIYLETCFLELNKSKLNYCLLRNFKELPEKIGNDIDILVDDSDLKDITKVFTQNAEKLNIKFLKSIKRDGYIGLYFFAPESCEILLIDLFYKLQKRWKDYADVKYILSNKIKYKQFNVINPTHEIYTIALKEILTYGYVRIKYLARFNEIKVDKTQFDAVSFQFLKTSSRESLYNLINNDEVFKSSKRINLKLINIGFITWLKDVYLYITCFLTSKIKDIIGPNPMVCLIGPDGVGKSTLSSALESTFVKANLFRDAKVFHHRFELIPALSVLIGKKQKRNEEINPDFGHINNIHSWSRTILYMLYYSMDFMLGWYIIIRAKLKNEFIIFDRYYFDFFIQNCYSAVSNKPKKFLYKFLPKPNVTIFLYANPYTVVARKKELTIEQHVKQNEQCMYILRSVVTNPIFLNCNGSISQNKKSIVSYSLKRIFQQ